MSAWRALVFSAWLLVALIHLLPLAGLAGAERLQALYGLAEAPTDALLLLLQHRAWQFGLLAAAALWALWQPALRLPTACLVLASDAGFLLLFALSSHSGPALQRVAWADGVSMVALTLVLIDAWRVGR